MQVRVEEVSAVEKKLVVEVPWATVADRLGAAFKELGKSVQLKGFRKGKVPRSVLEQMFGARVRSEVAVQLVRESFMTAATEHNLDAVSEPQVKDETLKIQKGQPFSFEAIVEVKGEVKAENYRGMELKKRRLELKEEAVDQALEQLQRENTELRPIEDRGELAASDFCAISLKGKIGDREVEQPQLTVDLSESEREPLPGLVEALIGVSTTAKDHELKLSIPEDFRDEEIAGKTAELTISVIDARQKDVPELDDEFAKDVGEGETLDELRAATRKRLEERAEDEIRGELRDAALKELIKRNQIPIASSLVERAAEFKERRFRAMLGLQPGQDADFMDDDLRAKLREGADDDVRGQLLVDAVATEEKLEVTDADLDERIAKMAESRGGQPARLRAEMDRDGRLDNLRFQTLQEKVLDFIIDRSVVTEVDPEQLAAEAKAEEEAKEAASAQAEGGADAPESAAEPTTSEPEPSK